MNRRLFIAAIPASCVAAKAQQPVADPALLRAIAAHLGYANGFRSKFATGIYQRPSVSRSSPDATLNAILERLTGDRTLPEGAAPMAQGDVALIHHVDPIGFLHAWLIGSRGVIAHGRAPMRYTGLDFLRDPLRIESRTATRAPLRRGVSRPPPAPVNPTRPPAAALAEAATFLLPGAVGEALNSVDAARGHMDAPRLFILPARDTGIAPYAALPVGDDVLAARWAPLILPDIETLADKGRVFEYGRVEPRRALLVGNPDLTRDPAYEWAPLGGAEDEVRAFAQRFGVPPANVLIGAQATRSRVLDAIDGYGEASIVYLATHGVANSVNPMDGSFLALKEGHLYGQDLRGKRFEAWGAWHPLVILSACQSGLGKTFAGGTYGVARGWIAAGAGQVVASLWNVDDRATQQLMTGFAEHAFGPRRRSPEEALRRAELEARDAFGDDPAAWASFSILGAPGKGQRDLLDRLFIRG